MMYTVFFVELGAFVGLNRAPQSLEDFKGTKSGFNPRKLVLNKLLPPNAERKGIHKAAEKWSMEHKWLVRMEKTPGEAFELSQDPEANDPKLIVVLVEPAAGGIKTPVVRLLGELHQETRIADLYNGGNAAACPFPYIVAHCWECSGSSTSWNDR
jgi:hypothetical protein